MHSKGTIAVVLGAFGCQALELALIHALGPAIGTLQFAFLRALGNFVLLATIAAWTCNLRLKSAAPKLQIARGILSAANYWAAIYAYSHLPLADATAIGYTRGIFLAMLGAVFLSERVSTFRWLGVAAGIFGTALMVRPTFSNLGWIYLIALAAPALNAAMTTVTKIATRADPINTTFFWVSNINLALALPALAQPWTWPDYGATLLIALTILCGPLATYLSLWAVRHAAVSFLAPFDYTRLVIGTTAAVAIFGEPLSTTTCLGIAVIVAGCFAQTANFRISRIFNCQNIPKFSKKISGGSFIGPSR